MLRGRSCAGALFYGRGSAVADYPFEAVIFDMDGVLVDTEYFYVQELCAFSREFGIPVTEDELKAQVGASHQAFVRMIHEWFGRIGRADLTPEDSLGVYLDWAGKRSYDYRALLNPGVAKTIDALKDRGVRVALASSSRMVNILRVLDECGLTGKFDPIVSGEQFIESKPEPDIYLHMISLLGLPASACCCVEDSVPGITAGKRAGLTVIAKREERFGFSQDNADAIVDAIPDLLRLGRGKSDRLELRR